MAKGYWIGHVDVLNPEPYGRYAALAREAVHAHGGRYLVRRGVHKTPEGDWHSIPVMIEFDSYEQAVACYESPAYQAAKRLRQGHADAALLIVEGSDEDADR